jgi:hypothetical protein
MSIGFLRLLPALLVVAACTTPGTVPRPPTAESAATVTPAAHLPPNLRSDLARRWFDESGDLRWPPNDGFAARPDPVVLPRGLLVDRFGLETGRFFSPKDAPYAARALPYVCEKLTYSEFRVDIPVVAWTGKAAPWFDEPGGATQFETDASAARLLADHELEVVPHSGPAPCNVH